MSLLTHYPDVVSSISEDDLKMCRCCSFICQQLNSFCRWSDPFYQLGVNWQTKQGLIHQNGDGGGLCSCQECSCKHIQWDYFPWWECEHAGKMQEKSLNKTANYDKNSIGVFCHMTADDLIQFSRFLDLHVEEHKQQQETLRVILRADTVNTLIWKFCKSVGVEHGLSAENTWYNVVKEPGLCKDHSSLRFPIATWISLSLIQSFCFPATWH